MTIRKAYTKRKRGQGMTEYIIIVALIAIAAVGIITVFGDNIRALFGGSVDVLAGSNAATVKTSKQGSHAGTRGLTDFTSE